jgi:hypothetical protein
LRVKSAIAVGLPVALLLAFLVERWIVTDREALVDLLEGAGQAADRGDLDTVLSLLDEEYREGNRDRESTDAYVRSLWATYQPRVDVDEVDVLSLEGDQARARIRADVSPARRAGDSSLPFGMERYRLRLDLHLVRRPQGWRIRSATPGGPFGGLR